MRNAAGANAIPAVRALLGGLELGRVAWDGGAATAELEDDEAVAAALERSGESVGGRAATVGRVLRAEPPAAGAAIAAYADAVAAVAEPRTDHRGSDAYKRHIVQTFVKRILTNLAQTEQKAA